IHLMYAVREEVDVLKEQIKELNSLLKTLASPEQMAQFQAQSSPALAPRQDVRSGSSPGSGWTTQGH
uniref:TSC22 domain family protein 1 n=1 Tax=Oncorhynchus kisutch TaxID=8019 RepID=A0A8C7JX84_ONCKI